MSSLSQSPLSRNLAAIPRQMLMLLMVIGALVPIYFVVVTALKTPNEYIFNKWGLPSELTIENVGRLLTEGNHLRWLLNSLLISTISVALGVLVASLMAYGFARYTFPGKNALFIVVTSLLVLSPVVLIIPLFKTMVALHLQNTYPAAIVIYTGIMLPISTYLLTSFFKSIPPEIIDAALIDGCSSFRIFSQIMLPLSRPAVLTAAFTNWLYVWNEILIALIFLQDDKMRTLMAGLVLFKGKYTTDIPLTMAGVAIAIIPTFVLYLFGQQYFVRGLTAGAVK